MIFGGGTSGTIGTGIVYTLYDNFTSTSNTITAGWNRLEGTTDRATARIQKSMNRMKAGFAGIAAGAMLLAPTIMGVGKSMEFNAVMSEVYAKSATTNIETQKLLANEAMRLGEATKFSAKQAAEGQSFLAMAGFKTNEIISAMPGVLNLASAGNLELAESADIASNILTAMGLKANEMGRVADVLAVGATSANVSVSMLGETFSYAAASAKGLGWTLEQTTAMAGMLGNIGIQGSSAGTAIQNFNRFLTKLDDSKLAAMNMTMSDIVDQAGNMKSAPEVLAKIMDGVKDMGNFQRTAVLGELFGPRGQKTIAAFNAALETGFDFTDYIAKLEGASGQAQVISDQMMDNLKGDLTILGSVWETTLIKIGNAVEPFLRPIVQAFSKLISVIGKIAQSPIGKWAIRLTAIVGALAVAIGGVTVAINLSKFAAGKAALAFASMGQAQVAATFASKGLVRGLMAATKAALSAIVALWPVILIGAAIAGVIWVMRKALKSFDEVMAGTAEPAKGFLGFLQKLGGIMRAVVEIWKSANGEGFTMSEQLAAALDKLGILEFAIAMGTWIVRLKAFFKGVGQGIKAAWNAIKPIFKMIGQGLNWIGGLFDKLGFSMNKNTTAMSKWEQYGKIVGIVIMATLVPAFIALAISVIAATWPIILIIAVIVAVIWAIKNWGKITEWFKELWGKVWGWIKEKAIGFWDSIKGLGNRIKDWGKNLVLKLKEGISNAWTSFKNWLSGLWEKLIAPIKKGLEFFGIGGEDEGTLSVEGGDTENIQNVSELAMVNATNKAAQVNVPEPVVLHTTQKTEVLKNVNVDMDGAEIRHNIDVGTEEDLNRQ